MFKKILNGSVNGLMAVLLLGLLILPITSIGLTGVQVPANQESVLSAQDERVTPATCDCPLCPPPMITPEMEREIYERLKREEEQEIQNNSLEIEETLDPEIPTE